MSNKLSLRVFIREVYIEKPENRIIDKLRYGSTTDFGDAKAILIRQNGKLDFEYLDNITKLEDFEEDLQNLFTAGEKYKRKRRSENNRNN